MLKRMRYTWLLTVLAALLLAGCGSSGSALEEDVTPQVQSTEYLIGPGDQIQVFVWRNPDLTISVPVRPDGKISTPLIEDMQAVGKSPTQLSRDIEAELAQYVKSPQVNVIVTGFVGVFSEQIRVVGKAAAPRALSYRRGMTLLDVMIEVGGLAEGASGNRAKVLRSYGGQQREVKVRINDLLDKGKISANLKMLPGDVLIIPESRF
ncbi:MAG: XrtA/PEP-CTERM system exopolysaccharide export protein [Gammaproteobacteria bacterium]